MKDWTGIVLSVLTTLVFSLGGAYLAFIKSTAALEAQNLALKDAFSIVLDNIEATDNRAEKLDERLRRIEENTAAIIRELELTRQR
jgi:hypothetical protein